MRFPLLRKSPLVDGALLATTTLAWLAIARSGGLAAWPSAAIAMLAAGTALLACKGLSWPPLWRPWGALLPVVLAGGAATWLAPSTPLPAGATTALIASAGVAAAYLAFTLVRRERLLERLQVEARRAWHAFDYVGVDGRPDGFDYGRWYAFSERWRARWRRRSVRVLFPPKSWEAQLRSGDWIAADRLDFAPLTTEAIAAHDLVVPLSMFDLDALEPLRPLLANNRIALPSRASIDLCHDKPRFNRAMAAAGFDAYVPPMDDALPFPYILKGRCGEWGENSHVIASVDDERRFAAELADPAYFRQAYVPGQVEYTTHMLVRGGRCVRSLTLEFTFDHPDPVKSRDCQFVQFRLRRGGHDRLFAKMLRAIGFEGLCCFNYKMLDGRPMVFEVNPRLGASLAPYFHTFARSFD